jgi:hypothetical protein
VGDSAVVNAIAPGGYHQASSLSEEINNRLATPPARSLPTYVILPYNAGSLAVKNWAAPPGAAVYNLGASYGYLQFLTHFPDLKDDLGIADGNISLNALGAGLRRYNKPNWRQSADFVSDDPNHGYDYFFVWGQLLALSVTFSLSDLHSQNTIVHRHPYPYSVVNSWPKPHLIDLEDGFKWPMSSLRETGITVDNLNKAQMGEQRLQTTGDKTVGVNAQFRINPAEHEKNQAFIFHGGVATRLRPNAENRRAMAEGFLSVMELLSRDNGAFVAWVAGLGNVVARFVPTATRDFYPRLHAYGDESQGLPARQIARIRSARNYWNQLRAQVQGPVQMLWTRCHPFFAIEHADHAFFDFDNRDIPYFVRELGHSDLLNSRGHKVVPSAVHADQQLILGAANNVDLDPDSGRPDPAAMPAGNFAPGQLPIYLPDTAINVVTAQLHDLAAPPPPAPPGNAFFDRATKLLQEILNIPNLTDRDKLPEEAAFAGDVVPTPNITFNRQLNGHVVRAGAGGFEYVWNAAGGANAWVVRPVGGGVPIYTHAAWPP